MIILVTGANGQLGRSFQKVAPAFAEAEFHFFDSTSLDITDEQKVMDTADSICPDYIINCAAYTAVDKAESETAVAYLVNEKALQHLANAAEYTGATLIHFSSDYVYHIETGKPLHETDKTNPQGVYAQSKLAGEKIIQDSACKSIIIRTSWVYSEYGHNFVKTMLRLGTERDELSIVNDQIGSPTYATDIAKDTLEIISQYAYIPDHKLVVNYAGNGHISWYDFAKEIFDQKKVNLTLHSIPSSSYPTPAARPSWSVMDMTHLSEIFGLQPRDWKASLAECLENIS